jgi:NADH-quinone oxidoreductase subunit H
MTPPFADVVYFEPWWMQIAKAVVLFALGLQIVPLVLLY